VTPPPYKVKATTKTGTKLRRFTPGYQSAGVDVNALNGNITWKSISLNSTLKHGGDLNTDFEVIPGPNSGQAFQFKGTFSTDSRVPIRLVVPGKFVDDSFDDVQTNIFIPPNNEKKNLVFNFYITEKINMLYFRFMYAEPIKAGVTKFTVSVGNDLTVTLIQGKPTPVVKPLYPPAGPDSKYTLKNVFSKSSPADKTILFLSMYGLEDGNGSRTYMATAPNDTWCHWILKPITGTTDVYSIQNVYSKEMDSKDGSFLNTKADDKVYLWTDPNNPTCQWIVSQVKPGENVYTIQNVWLKGFSQRASYLSKKSGLGDPVLSSNPNIPESRWHLNLA